jgi:hypothetical protein
VFAECREIQRSLSELPYFFREIVSPQLTSKFADMIDNYNDKIRYLNHRFWNEEHNSLCIAMFRSVLTPYVYSYDDKFMRNSFTQTLAIQTLDSVPGLRTLHLRHGSTEEQSAQFVRMIYHLRHLQVFTCFFHCTDEVIEQLGLYCTHLKEVYLCDSLGVTNASVQHLLQLRKLELLYLAGTKIDQEHYGLLLSELPQIKNITFWSIERNILDHITLENLDNISYVRGHVEDISMLAQRCRNITELFIELRAVDLSGLADLTTLRTVRLSGGDYARCNLNAVLTGIGSRLTDLTLSVITHVDLQDIVTLCPTLASLSLSHCTLLALEQNTPLDPQLPHFRNVTALHIAKINQDNTNYNYIRHYISLKIISLFSINIFTAEFMREVVRSGTLSNLEQFCVREYGPGALTMEALELLIEHCSHLKTIRYLGTCHRLNPGLIRELKRQLLVRNLDLEIIE